MFFEKETFLYRAVIIFFVLAGSSEESKLDRKYPVVVLIHGESFSWGSGNIYDGRALATYGQLVVITVNFRLGVFGKCYLYVYLQALRNKKYFFGSKIYRKRDLGPNNKHYKRPCQKMCLYFVAFVPA